MYMTIHVVPTLNLSGVGYMLSLAAPNSAGAVPFTSQFSTLDSLLQSFRNVGIDEASIHLAESTLKGGLAFTLPGVDLVAAYSRLAARRLLRSTLGLAVSSGSQLWFCHARHFPRPCNDAET
jgi:hypothetical protein